MDSGTVVRTEHDDDAGAVAAVLADAFGDGGRVAHLVESLRASEAWDRRLAFVATPADAPRSGGVVAAAPVGYIAVTHGLLDAPRRLVDILVLSPLAALPAWQRRGIGGQLVRHALEAAAGTAPLVFLEGSPSYYRRFGFEAAGGRGFRRPSLRIPEPAFMVRPLDTYEPWMTGTLVYPDPFWRHDCVGLRTAGDDVP